MLYWLLISAFTVSDPIWPFHQFDSTILISTPQFIPPPPIYCRNSVILPNWPPEFKGVSSKFFFEEQSDYGKVVTVTFWRVSLRKKLWRSSKKWSKWLGLCWRWPFVCPYCPMSRMPRTVIQLWLMVIWWSKWQMPAGLALKEAWLECINKNQQLLPVLPQN